jgi:hypothetical protein
MIRTLINDWIRLSNTKKLLINIIVTAAMTVVGFADVLTYHNDNSAIFGVPAYYKGALYYGPVGEPMLTVIFPSDSTAFCHIS